MDISFNSLISNLFVNSLTEKRTNVFNQFNRKIYIIAVILFVALVTAALIYQRLKGNNERTIRKIADLPEETALPKRAGLLEEVERTLELTSSGERLVSIQGTASNVFDEEMPPLLDGKKNEEKGTVAINVTPTISDQTCESLDNKERTNGFPVPFETLKRRGLFKPTEMDSIITTVDQALRTSQGERVPSEYTKLQGMIGSDKLLELLYQEAKILAHAYSVRDLENDGYVSHEREYKKQYPIILFTNLSILVSSLCKCRQFRFDL